jgi:hypothetical protein
MHLLALVVAGLGAVVLVWIVAEAARGVGRPRASEPGPCWSCGQGAPHKLWCPER